MGWLLSLRWPSGSNSSPHLSSSNLRPHFARVISRRVPGVWIGRYNLIHRDSGVGAVAARRAGQDAGQAVKIAGGKERVAQGLATDVQPTLLIQHGHVLDGGHDHHGCVIGVCMKEAPRRLAVPVPVLRQKIVLIFLKLLKKVLLI